MQTKLLVGPILVLVCLFPLCGAVRADSITTVSMLASFGNAATGGSEAFFSEFLFDRTIQNIVPNSIQVFSTGTLGAFSFDDFTVQTGTFNGLPSFVYDFFWTDHSGDTIGL